MKHRLNQQQFNQTEFIALIPVNLKGSLHNQSQIIDQQPEIPETIIDEARTEIDTITKRALFASSLIGSVQFLLNLYDYYETWNKLNEYQAIVQTIWSILNGSLQIVSLIYLSNETDMFISALIVLTVVNPVLQALSFAMFNKNKYDNDFLTNFDQINNKLIFFIIIIIQFILQTFY